jgi:hypothetical protein
MSSGNFSQYNEYVFAQIKWLSAFEYLKRRALKDNALRWARQGATMLVDRCGDEFIYGRQMGGDLTAIIQFSTTSQSNQQQVAMAIDAAFGPFASGSADRMERIESLKSLTTSRVYFLRNGGQGDIPETIDGFLAAARAFPTQVAQHPRLIALATDSIKNTENIPDNINFNGLRDASLNLGKLSKWLDEAYENRGNLEYIQHHQAEFIIAAPVADTLKTAWNQNEKAIDDLMHAGTQCADSFARCALIPPPQLPSFERRADAPVPVPGPVTHPAPEYELQWMSVNEQGKPYTEDFIVDQLNEFKTYGKFVLSNPQGRIQTVDYSCSDTPDSRVCGSSFPRSAQPWIFDSTDFLKGDLEIMNDGLGFNWYRKFIQRYPIDPRTGRSLFPTDHWLEKYTAHYALLRRVCVRNCN